MVAAPAALRLTLFHRLSAAEVMSASVSTTTSDLTRYAVPALELCTEAEPLALMVAALSVAVGCVTSGASDKAAELQRA